MLQWMNMQGVSGGSESTNGAAILLCFSLLASFCTEFHLIGSIRVF
jgi:hypothetical protein